MKRIEANISKNETTTTVQSDNTIKGEITTTTIKEESKRKDRMTVIYVELMKDIIVIIMTVEIIVEI